MNGARRPLDRRRLAGVAGALVLALGLALSPHAARPVAAADPLRVSADATYTLDPEAGRVHVAIQYQVTDLKPNSAQFIYYYSGYRVPIQPEAKSVRASDSGGSLSIKTQDRIGFIELTIDFRAAIYYRQTAKFTVRYDLVGGKPRTLSPIRVGKAFATWGVWAWGDPGRGTVEVNLPQGFGSTVEGDPMSKTSSGGRETLRAEPAKPETFFAILSAENPLAYTRDRLSLDGDVEIVVMAWPEDDPWDTTVADTLRTAMPRLRELIGLAWPVEHDLNVRERYTPSLEGYAGLFFTETQRIDVSEDLDPVVIVHEASHAWFNEGLFVERWIYEGLAQEYAWRVQTAVGGDNGELPDEPTASDSGFVRLERWSFPEVIRDQQVDDTERYGYQASFWIIHRIVEAAGEDRMRAAFAAADARTTAYPGAGTPEEVSATNGWKRFLDLVEPLDGDDAATDQSLRDFVLPSGSADDLDDRAGARKAYRELLDAGDGWLPGWYVRKPMGEWSFSSAEERIDAATSVLALRDQVDQAASELGVTPGDGLRQAYEGATGDLDAATNLANDQIQALTAIKDAKTKVEAVPDLVSTIGLLGSLPRASYDAALAAFTSGDVAGAKQAADDAEAMVTNAVAVGQQRIAIAVGVALGMLLLLIVLVVTWRRRRRRRALVLAAATAAADDPRAAGAAEPPASATEAVTLADPDAVPPIESGPPPDPERGGEVG